MFKSTKSISCAILALGLGIFSISCSKKEDTVTPVYSGYLLGYRAQNGAATSSDGDADYVLTASDLMSGTISASGNGIEQTGWCYYANVDSTYFTMNYDQNECTGYVIRNGVVVQKGKFVFDRMDYVKPANDNNTLISIGAPWGGGSYDCQIQLIDAKAISVTKTKTHPIYTSYDSSGTQLNAWPTGAYVDGSKLFVSFYPLNGETWATPNTDTAYVSVYSYPDLEYIKTFKDARTGPIGFYGASPAIMTDESGNHYTISNTSLNAGYTQTTKNSGILKIKAGEDQFDADYFFDVEASSGYELLTGVYVGNGLAVGRVVIEENAESGTWATFSYSGLQPCKMVVIDLINKTITDVADVPAHGGQYQTPLLVEDGKVYASINSGTETYVYRIDPATAKGTKGAKIAGREIQAFFKY